MINVDIALKRLKWVISKKKNEEDIEAFNSVLNYIDATREKTIQSYEPFAKLFLWIFKHKALYFLDEKIKHNLKENVSANQIMADIQKVIETPMEWLLEDFAEQVKYIRFETLYKDYSKEVRKAKELARKNRIPAMESPTLQEEYQLSDIQKVIEEKNKRISQMKKDLELIFTKPYTKEQAEYFLKSEIHKLLIANSQ